MTLYINACPREESRTARLARAYLARISDVTELNVYDQPLVPLDRERLAHRESLIAGGKWHDPMFDYAHQFADADDIFIAAPYWDLGFPAQLKTYIENIYVPGIVSAYNDHGQPCGLCRARSLTYITTAGGAYDPRFSFDYLTAMAKEYFGIRETRLIYAECLDICGNDPEAILQSAIDQIERSADR